MITVSIAYLSIRATLSFQETVHSSISDQITFASWNFNRILNNEIDRFAINQLGTALQNIKSGPDGRIEFKDVAERTGSACMNCNTNQSFTSKSFDQFFIYDPEHRVIDYFEKNNGLNYNAEELLIQLSDSLLMNHSSAGEFVSSFGFISGVNGNEKILFTLMLPETNIFEREFIVAVKGPAEILVPAIEKVWLNEHLIPPNLSGYEEISEQLYLSLQTPSGTVLYSNLSRDDKVIQFDGADNNLDPISKSIYLKAGAINQTLIGHNSKQQIMLLLGLLVIALLLTTWVIYFVKKETDLYQMRSGFISSASHDLRTPITQIRMYSETLLEGRTRNDSEKKKAIKIIHQASERLTSIVTNILDYSNIEKRNRGVRMNEFNVDKLLNEVIATFSPQVKAKGILINTHEVKLPVVSDKYLVRQIISNLLDNAIKYSEMGQMINIRLQKKTEYFALEIQDFGQGISKKNQSKIWNAYWRDKKNNDSSITGFGLGLAIVKNNVSILRGSVSVESSDDGGSIFSVTIPINDKR